MSERRKRAGSAGSSLAGMIPTSAYHGAHRPPVNSRPVTSWTGTPGLVAFVHDLLTDGPLPDVYGTAEVLVSDLPWRLGFPTFNERAGVTDDRTYDEFMEVIAGIVERATVPTYLITGRHALPKLPEPHTVGSTMLNEDEAVIIGYRCGDEADNAYGMAPEFLHALTTRYKIAGDPCCGYGRTARIFLRAGLQAVVSDMNPLCIGYIADHALEWTPR